MRDQVLPFTKVIAAVIIPFLVTAVVLLYGLPSQTDLLFAWTITPPLSAMFLASAYVGGIWFFAQVLRQWRWHRVARGFPAVIAFASLASAATFLHWDRFHFGHISFVTWVVLYVTTPFLVLAALLLNRRQDSGLPEENDFAIPLHWRVGLAAVGAVSLVTGLVLFIVPQPLVDSWAWQLTPLTARIVGAILTLPGMVNLWMLRDARWSAFRWVFQAQIASLVFLIGALILARNDLDPSRPVTPVVVGGLVFSLVAYAAFYDWCERGVRRASAAG